jgi:hypothetical protein
LSGFKEEIHEPQETKEDTLVERTKTLKNPRGIIIGSSSIEMEINVFTRVTRSVSRKNAFEEKNTSKDATECVIEYNLSSTSKIHRHMENV